MVNVDPNLNVSLHGQFWISELDCLTFRKFELARELLLMQFHDNWEIRL